MRFDSRFANAAVGWRSRSIEGPSGVLEVRAPRDWSSAQIEAWADLGCGSDPIAAYAERAAAAGAAFGLLEDPQAFEGELAGSMALGLAAPGRVSAGPVSATQLEAIEF